MWNKTRPAHTSPLTSRWRVYLSPVPFIPLCQPPKWKPQPADLVLPVAQVAQICFALRTASNVSVLTNIVLRGRACWSTRRQSGSAWREAAHSHRCLEDVFGMVLLLSCGHRSHRADSSSSQVDVATFHSTSKGCYTWPSSAVIPA